MEKYLKKKFYLKFFSNIKYTKNKISVLSILIFCICGFIMISGCNEYSRNNNFDSKKVEILSYEVTTKWTTGCCGHYENHTEQGFFPTEKMGYGAKYNITGKIKNTGEKDINLVNININFLAKNGTILFNTEVLNATYKIYNLSTGETKNFSIEVWPELYSYFSNPDFYNKLRNNFIIVHSLEFNIS